MADAKAYPLDDTYYLAEALRKWNKVYTTGVFPETNNMRTVANNDMSVTVTKGFILLNDGDEGLMVWLDEDVNVPINTASGTLNRIDAITVQWDKLNNKVTVYPKSSNESVNPALPVTERDETDYEAFLSYVSVPSGTTAISSGNITDKRPDAAVCGYIKSRAESIPTDMLQAQFLDLLEQYRKAIEDIGSLAVVDGSITIVKLNEEVMQLFTDINGTIATLDSDLNGKINGINGSISTINGNIATINTNLGYKFDLGSIGGVRNVQNGYGSILKTSPNLNSITYTGEYYVVGATNNPSGYTTGYLSVISNDSGNYVLQIFRHRDEAVEFERRSRNGIWTDWKLVSGSVGLFSNGTSTTGAEGSTVNITLEEIKKYGKLRIILFHPSDTSYKTTVDMPIDALLTSGDKRGAGNVMSTATTIALSTAWTVLTFSTNSLAINVCKYMGFAGGSTPGNPGTLYIRSIEGLPA